MAYRTIYNSLQTLIGLVTLPYTFPITTYIKYDAASSWSMSCKYFLFVVFQYLLTKSHYSRIPYYSLPIIYRALDILTIISFLYEVSFENGQS